MNDRPDHDVETCPSCIRRRAGMTAAALAQDDHKSAWLDRTTRESGVSFHLEGDAAVLIGTKLASFGKPVAGDQST